MVHGRASRTAIWVSVLRGLADLEPGALVEDRAAAALVPAPYRAILALAHAAPRTAAWWLERAARTSNGRSRHLALRTRAIDDVVARATASGCAQVVLLGAGLDARAHRMDALRDAVVYEVDHPSTQEYKRARAASLPRVARALRYVTCDFARERIEDVLLAAGFDRAARTLFIWEGVTMYLPEAAIAHTLAAVSRLAAPGSALAMTYHDRQTAVEGVALHLVVSAVGEPIVTRLRPDEVARLLGAHGFTSESDEGGREWSARYLGQPGGSSLERLVVARRA